MEEERRLSKYAAYELQALIRRESAMNRRCRECAQRVSTFSKAPMHKTEGKKRFLPRCWQHSLRGKKIPITTQRAHARGRGMRRAAQRRRFRYRYVPDL